jgi:hypothetical protein
MRDYREALIQHVGGQPSFVELALIDRAARLALRIDLLDRRIEEGKTLTIRDQNYYVAWGNSLTRLLGHFGRRPRGEVRVVSHGPQLDALMGEDFLGAFVPEEDDLTPPSPPAKAKRHSKTSSVVTELLGDGSNEKRERKAKHDSSVDAWMRARGLTK